MKTIPSDIAKGMKVLDSSQVEIGTVDDFRFSENEDEPGVLPAELDRSDTADHSLMRDLAEALVPIDLPDVLRERLMLEGYVRVAPRGIGTRHYVLPDQIVAVTDGSLILNVDRAHLIKL